MKHRSLHSNNTAFVGACLHSYLGNMWQCLQHPSSHLGMTAAKNGTKFSSLLHLPNDFSGMRCQWLSSTARGGLLCSKRQAPIHLRYVCYQPAEN